MASVASENMRLLCTIWLSDPGWREWFWMTNTEIMMRQVARKGKERVEHTVSAPIKVENDSDCN